MVAALNIFNVLMSIDVEMILLRMRNFVVEVTLPCAFKRNASEHAD